MYARLDSMSLDASQINAFRALEEGLWVAETRGNRPWMDAILSPMFTEHGRSGGVHDRASILDAEMPATIGAKLPLDDFEARLIGPTTVLVTYTSDVMGDISNRASIWQHDGERWLLEFHQGTPVPVVHTIDIDTAELRRTTFGTSLRGYDQAGVDQLLRDLAEQIDSGEAIDRKAVKSARFELSLRGYTCEEVDHYMAALVQRLS